MKAPNGTGLRRISYPLPERCPLVSVPIPSKDHSDLLRDAVASVLEAGYQSKEIIIIDNGSKSPAQRALLAELAQNECIWVLVDPGPFNFSRLMNMGRQQAKGDVLLLLNDDIKAIETSWLSELVSLAVQPDTGCVGALLLYKNGMVQHGGVIMGLHGGAEHAFRYAPSDGGGTGYRLTVRREVSAVTAACLAVKRELFDAVAGFDENLPVALNVIDFCLKLRERGFRNLMTPYARLCHYYSVTHGLDAMPDRLARLARETA